MRILYVADGRSPIARSWIESFILAGDEVHLASSHRTPPWPGLASQEFVPVAFSWLKAAGGQSVGSRGIGLRTRLRHYLGPLTVPWAARHLTQLCRAIQPELIHALRLPFEGMVAAASNPVAPLVVSSWGNDFTLHAPGSFLMRRLTRATLTRADGLHADCQRDQRIANQWGFDQGKPVAVLPGNGGLEEVFVQPQAPKLAPGSTVADLLDSMAADRPMVVNPRGFRAYVRNDTFFRAIPLVLEQKPDVLFVCPTMKDEPMAERWLTDLGITDHVRLLGRLEAGEMSALLRRAQLSVSPSEHDGTPNSMLEAMASGAVPVAGDLESIREWIVDGRNGRLIDPADPAALAEAIVHSLESTDWLKHAQTLNRKIIEERATRKVVYQSARELYQQVQRRPPVL